MMNREIAVILVHTLVIRANDPTPPVLATRVEPENTP